MTNTAVRAYTTAEATRLSRMGQADLGAWVSEIHEPGLWSIQRDILRAASEYRSTTTVPSCNSSGKTFLASWAVWAFLDSYRPGVPCEWCEFNGLPYCGGSKVITTSSTYDHLKLVLWTEIRRTRRQIGDRLAHLPWAYEGELKTRPDPDHPEWFIVGLNPEKAEGIQGFHAPHKLIVGEEATALGEETAQGIGSLMASGDARSLFIYNPTEAGAYVERIARDPNATRIRIRAWDTPYFTGEAIPVGATLTTPDWLESLKASGRGPGTYTWQTRVEAEPWSVGTRGLIAGEWVDLARTKGFQRSGVTTLGVDLARYGDAENVIAYRHGPVATKLEAFPGMDQSPFWRGPVADACVETKPDLLIYDADGLGSGVGESIVVLSEKLERLSIRTEIIGFRGGKGAGNRYLNTRSRSWWDLREKRFQSGKIRLDFDDQVLHDQLTSIEYGFTDKGAIKVESKENMRKRNLPSPDRADALMYAFAYDDVQEPIPTVIEQPERSDEAMWERNLRHLDELQRFRHRRAEIDPVTGAPDEW